VKNEVSWCHATFHDDLSLKVTGNLFEFILQNHTIDVDVPWKPDGILYPPIILEELMQIPPFQLRITILH
jgi:hypothetical protein